MEKSETRQQDMILKTFGHDLTERLNKLAKINGDAAIEDFILNSAFEFLDEFEWTIDLDLSGSKVNKGFINTLGQCNTKPITESEMENIARLNEVINHIIEICGYDNRADFISDATRKFLDKIDNWIDISSEAKSRNKVFNINSEIEAISENDSRIMAHKKFQLIMQKEFMSYIHRLPC